MQHVFQRGYIDTIEEHGINVIHVILDTKESFCAKPFWFINYAYIKRVMVVVQVLHECSYITSSQKHHILCS